jgi:2,4-dienoyl-CoA reductase-like NADH-dependent reductase (Old Yellow Enzyme family)
MLPEAKPALDAAAILSSPLTLACGAVLPNRLAKAAMSELLGDARNRATSGHQTLYAAWGRNGPGLLVTGNVQIDRRHLEHAGNVAIEGRQDPDQMAALRAWSAATRREGAQIWSSWPTPADRPRGGSTRRPRRPPPCRWRSPASSSARPSP